MKMTKDVLIQTLWTFEAATLAILFASVMVNVFLVRELRGISEKQVDICHALVSDYCGFACEVIEREF
jgi:hypothetical protein